MTSWYVQYDDVLLYLSDTAPNTVRAEKVIQHLYSIMIYVTCMAHAIHRLAKEIRTNFQDIRNLY